MTSASTKKQQRRASKRENDEFSREMAVVRAGQRRRRRIRTRLITAVSIVVAAALVAGGIGLFLWKRADDALAGPKNMRSDGIVLTGASSKIVPVTTAAIPPHGHPATTAKAVRAPSGVLPVDLYLDYGRPASVSFGHANAAQLSSWLKAGLITLEIHPVALGSAHHRYSARAANALACVAATSPASFVAASDALLAAAARKGFSYPGDAGTVTLLKKAKVTSPTIASCVTGETYAAWVTAASHRATTGALPHSKLGRLASAPVALLNGARYTGAAKDATAFATFAEAQAEKLPAAPGSGN
jgi:hypothetical protein